MFLWVLQAHQSQNLTFSSFNPCPSLSSIATDDRKQFQWLDTVLNKKKKLDYYFRNSVAKTRCSFLQDSKLLVCTWRHDGHVGGPKHFSPLETKPYFHVNSRRKKNYFVLTTNMTALSRGCKPRISLTWLVNIYSRSLLQLKLYW